MVQWVYEAAQQSGFTEEIIVATPDQEIVDAVAAFGGKAMLTSHEHQTGTDRIAEVAEAVSADFYVNVQGDEPLMRSESILTCAQLMLEDARVEMASVYHYCVEEELDQPMVVKVVTDNEGYALYFSRFAIPYPRNPRVIPVKKHIGLYAYRRDVLQRFSTWPMGKLETAESLEQLRFMENGVRIKMAEAAATELAVDTPEQAEEVRRLLAARS